MKKPKKPRKLEGAKLTDALDDVVRQILHTRYPHPVCFVCGRTSGWWHNKKNPHGIQVGHFITRQVHPLRWDLLNVWPQCSSCNQKHQWNVLPFTYRVISECGAQRIEYLNKRYHGYKNHKMTTVEKRQLLEVLKLTLDKQHSV
jgi:hypothetical protein